MGSLMYWQDLEKSKETKREIVSFEAACNGGSLNITILEGFENLFGKNKDTSLDESDYIKADCASGFIVNVFENTINVQLWDRHTDEPLECEFTLNTIKMAIVEEENQ